MNKEKLSKHVRLCRKNLKTKRVKCCLDCPFEEEISNEYPDVKELFKERRTIKNPRFWYGEY